jgi:nucleotide-binding universal stress UspA family protein
LERWGVLEAGSRKGDVEDRLGIHVQKHLSVAPNVVDAIVGLTAVDSFDLLVMSTHGHEANAILARSPSSLKVAQRAQLPTLFIPEGARSCVDLQTGQSKLNKVLLAVDHEPNAQPALVRVGTMLQNLGDDQSEVTLLYVGNKDKFPQINPPPNEKITWSRLVREGSAVSEIVRQAQEMEADMIVMVASGKRSLRDLITGSTISNVLKNSPCPVFTLPT